MMLSESSLSLAKSASIQLRMRLPKLLENISEVRVLNGSFRGHVHAHLIARERLGALVDCMQDEDDSRARRRIMPAR